MNEISDRQVKGQDSEACFLPWECSWRVRVREDAEVSLIGFRIVGDLSDAHTPEGVWEVRSALSV